MILSNFLRDLLVPEEEYPDKSNYTVVIESEGELIPVSGVRWDDEEHGLIIET